MSALRTRVRSSIRMSSKLAGSRITARRVRGGRNEALVGQRAALLPRLESLDRSSPVGLFNVIQKMSVEQRRDDEEIGFGSILHLGVSHVPTTTGFWLVERFHASSVSLRLEGGRSVPITEEDIECTLGVPRGAREIVAKKAGEVFPSLFEWRRQFGTANGTILPSDIYEKMAEHVKGGKLFNQKFLVIFSTIMIDFGTSRFANQPYFRVIEDVESVCQFNWRAAVIDNLVSEKNQWATQRSSGNRSYHGLLTFLLLFYLDRIEFERCKVTRVYPALLGWDDVIVKDQIKKEERRRAFGQGFLNVERVCRYGKKKKSVQGSNGQKFGVVSGVDDVSPGTVVMKKIGAV